MIAETIPALLRRNAETRGAHEALVDDHGQIDYAALDQRSRARAAQLVAQGVNKAHRVGLLAENSIDWAVTAYAVMRIGAVLVPLSTLLKPPELAAQLETAGVRHLLAERQVRGRDMLEGLDRGALPSLAHVWFTDEWTGAAAIEVAQALEASVRPGDDMAVIFTSGSSGAPKGVIHTHGGALRATTNALAMRCVGAETRLYMPMPFFWIGGFGTGLIASLCAGATLLTEAAPAPGGTLAFLARAKATLFRGWPDQAARIGAHPDFAKTDLSALHSASLDAIQPPAKRSPPGARASVLGMTEAFGPWCGYPLDRDMPQSAWGSCGQPLPGVELRIVDADSEGKGSLHLKGPNLLRGICGREREEVFTADGWFDTGDMGWLDDQGFLFLAGRRDDMIKIKGASVYPAEVEAALVGIAGVTRAVVTGLGDGRLGALVVGGLSEADLQHQAKARLSAFKVPSVWRVVASEADVPRTSSDKIDRRAVATLLS